jgi:hypothetical protein
MSFHFFFQDFLVDTWNGQTLLKKFLDGRFSVVLLEWISFMAFLGIPLIVMCGGLFAQTERWWELTAWTWLCSISLFYIIFSMTCVYYEASSCISLIRYHYCEVDSSVWQVLRVAFLLRQRYLYSGYTHTSYFARGPFTDTISNPMGDLDVQGTRTTRTSIYSRLVQSTILQKMGLCMKLDAPQKTYTVADAQDSNIFLTRTSWNLEKAFCRPAESRFVAVIGGPDALSKAQLRSSVACSLLGTMLLALIFSAVITYLELGVLPQILYWLLVFVCFLIPTLTHAWRMYNAARNIMGEMETLHQVRQTAFEIGAGLQNAVSTAAHVFAPGTDQKSASADSDRQLCGKPLNEAEWMEQGNTNPAGRPRFPLAKPHMSEIENEAIFVIWESWRVSKPTDVWCWISLVFELLVFFIWPTAALFAFDNLAIAVLFVFVVMFSYIRVELNPSFVIMEIGSLEGVQSNARRSKRDNQAILNDIVANISTSRGQGRVARCLSFILAGFLLLCFITITSGNYNSDNTDYANKQFTYVNDFAYEKSSNLPYQTCVFGKQVFDDIPATTLVDWVFSAAMSYRSNANTQNQLDAWFGEKVVKNRNDIVDAYRNLTGTSQLPGAYRLYEFTQLNTAIVSIQGTTTTWDLFADAQLWSSACLFQLLRAIIPFGNVWTPIIADLIGFVSILKSPTSDGLAFYREITSFVKYLNESSNYTNLALTGHSLGGGLAIISASQTGVPAIAVSAPNAMLSRNSFVPKLTVDQINTLTFNIVPDRDPIAHVDDVGRLFQRIQCRTSSVLGVGCHSVDRTWCEILYTCGSAGRPILCECVHEWDYPEPVAIGNRTFAEACPKTATS